MPQPTLSDVHVNRPLTNVSLAFTQSADDFIAGKMFPEVRVNNKSDDYYVYPKDAWFRRDTRERAPSTESAGSGYELTTQNYNCKVRALHKDVDDQIRANTDAGINPDRDATSFVTADLLLDRELDWVSNFFTASVWTGSTTGGDITPGTLWSAGGSTPIEDMRAQIRGVKKKTGKKPNKLGLGSEVWDVLQDHPDFLDRIKITIDKIVTPALLATVLGIEEVLIGEAVENTAAEGATLATSFVHGKNALLVHTPRSAGLMIPAAGYTFLWSGFMGSNAAGMRIKRFRMEQLSSWRIEGEQSFDHNLVAAELGAFFLNPIA